MAEKPGGDGTWLAIGLTISSVSWFSGGTEPVPCPGAVRSLSRISGRRRVSWPADRRRAGLPRSGPAQSTPSRIVLPSRVTWLPDAEHRTTGQPTDDHGLDTGPSRGRAAGIASADHTADSGHHRRLTGRQIRQIEVELGKFTFKCKYEFGKLNTTSIPSAGVR